jgi:hypothetical protein
VASRTASSASANESRRLLTRYSHRVCTPGRPALGPVGCPAAREDPWPARPVAGPPHASSAVGRSAHHTTPIPYRPCAGIRSVCHGLPATADTRSGFSWEMWWALVASRRESVEGLVDRQQNASVAVVGAAILGRQRLLNAGGRGLVHGCDGRVIRGSAPMMLRDVA